MTAAAEAQADERGQPPLAYPVRPFQTGSAELGGPTLKIGGVFKLDSWIITTLGQIGQGRYRIEQGEDGRLSRKVAVGAGLRFRVPLTRRAFKVHMQVGGAWRTRDAGG